MPAGGSDFFQRFSDTFLTDDIDGFMTLIDPNCSWEIMATGETFNGADKVRELAERSVAARTHNDEAHMTFLSHIVTDDQMCLEYVHEGVITEDWPRRETGRQWGQSSNCRSALCADCEARSSSG